MPVSDEAIKRARQDIKDRTAELARAYNVVDAATLKLHIAIDKLRELLNAKK